MADHALLSASGSKKWLTCTPSARLEAAFPDEQSEFAKQGTLAHDLVEIALRGHYFKEPVPEHLNSVDKRRAAGYDEEMIEAARLFLEQAREITDPMDAKGIAYTVMVEQRLGYSAWAPEGFGTGDLVIVAGHCIWVRDFKYGQGVTVEAEENTQMMLYGLGAWAELSFAYDDINEVDLGISQPRINHFPSWRLSLKNLLDWGAAIAPLAALAWEGKGEFVSGPHCTDGFCRARFTCRARAEANMAAATQEFGDLPELLGNDEIAALLPRLDEIASWANDIKAYALKMAVDDGIKFSGWKLVEGRSNRYIADKNLAMARLVANGYPLEKIQTEPVLIGITALEEVVGSKKTFNSLLGDIIKKPPGKPTLVPSTDKRSEWAPTASADEDFG